MSTLSFLSFLSLLSLMKTKLLLLPLLKTKLLLLLLLGVRALAMSILGKVVHSTSLALALRSSAVGMGKGRGGEEGGCKRGCRHGGRRGRVGERREGNAAPRPAASLCNADLPKAVLTRNARGVWPCAALSVNPLPRRVPVATCLVKVPKGRQWRFLKRT